MPHVTSKDGGNVPQQSSGTIGCRDAQASVLLLHSGRCCIARNSLLDRFRPVGAPGPAGPTGVPAVDDEGTAAELIPVFEALDPTISEARERTDAAATRAQQTVAAARRQAAALVEQARMDSAAVRAEAAAQVSAAAAQEDEQLLADAGAEAQTLQSRGESRVPELASVIVADLVQDLLGRGTDNG